MYPVSNAFLEAVKANTRKYYWTGRHTILLYYPIENVVPNYTNIFNVYMLRLFVI